MKRNIFVLFLLFFLNVKVENIIIVKNVTNSSAQIECENYFSEQFSDYELKIISTNDFVKQNILLSINDVKSIALDNLTAGVIYSIQLFGISSTDFRELIDQTHLITRPNPPMNLNILRLREESAIIEWTAPDSIMESNSYLIGFTNDSQNISRYFEIKNISQNIMNMTHLISGKTYLLVILTYLTHQNQTISISEPLYKRFRTRPHPPIDLKVDQNSLSSHSFGVHWKTPKVMSEIDCFSITYKFKDKTFNKRVAKNDNWFVLVSKSIYPGINYKLKVTSVSTDNQTRISSESVPIYCNITTPPLPVTNIRTTSTDNSEIFIEWSDNQFSSQDSYEVSVREPISKNTSFHRINKRSLHISNLIPGHNYSISVATLSNGVSSNITTVYHLIPVQNTKSITIIIIILGLISLLSFILTGTYLYLNNKIVVEDIAPGNNNTVPNEYIELPQLITIDDNIRIDRNDLEFCDSNLIGSGHYGAVYNGYLMMKNAKLVIKEPVAIKVSSLETDMNSFLKEALIMKNFEHKNVLSLIGVSLENGSPIVVLPFMTNKDLLSYVRDESNAPTVKQLLNFAIDVSKGMEYLSSQHIIHRDLAARNCMLDKDLTVKVADFGLSRHSITKDNDESGIYMSENYDQLLPIKWMSIESIKERIFNQKTDVWSFGVLVWEILTRGETPYYSINNRVLLMHLSQGQRLPQPLYCPNDIYNTLINCWDSCPENRPTFTQLSSNLSEIIEKLENYIKQKQMKRNECNIYYDFSKQ